MADAEDLALDAEIAAQSDARAISQHTSRAEIVSPLDSVSFCRSALVETSVPLA